MNSVVFEGLIGVNYEKNSGGYGSDHITCWMF